MWYSVHRVISTKRATWKRKYKCIDRCNESVTNQKDVFWQINAHCSSYWPWPFSIRMFSIFTRHVMLDYFIIVYKFCFLGWPNLLTYKKKGRSNLMRYTPFLDYCFCNSNFGSQNADGVKSKYAYVFSIKFWNI